MRDKERKRVRPVGEHDWLVREHARLLCDTRTHERTNARAHTRTNPNRLYSANKQPLKLKLAVQELHERGVVVACSPVNDLTK